MTNSDCDIRGDLKRSLNRENTPTRSRLARLLVLAALLVLPSLAFAAPQLLPDAANFELTIQEDRGSVLPLGPSCGGEAALTLACRAFVVTLKNVGAHTVRLSRISCQEPVVTFEMKDPNAHPDGWWPISQAVRPRCSPWSYEDLRLRPGETTEYRTRMVASNRPPGFAPVAPRSYTIRAQWMLWGCTENPEGTDCLTPLQVIKPVLGAGTTTSDVEFQDPVEVTSNVIDVTSPTLLDLGPLNLGFGLSLASKSAAAEFRKRVGTSCAEGTIECTVFHYAIRNVGDRPVRNGRYTCSDFSIIPEYHADDGQWKQLQSRLQDCTANVYLETPILPGHTAEGDFTLGSLAPEFDTSLLHPAGKYEIRVRFESSACFASPDGSFCLQTPKDQTVVVSNEITINATNSTPNPSQVQ